MVFIVMQICEINLAGESIETDDFLATRTGDSLGANSHTSMQKHLRVERNWTENIVGEHVQSTIQGGHQVVR